MSKSIGERVKELAGLGLSNRDIAKKIGCSVATAWYWTTTDSSKKNRVSTKGLRRIKLKQDFVKAAGGKCQICGYDKCLRALEFHHLDPSKKTLAIADNIDSPNKVKEEIKKCILLCSNCHSEVEDGITKIAPSQLRKPSKLVS